MKKKLRKQINRLLGIERYLATTAIKTSTKTELHEVIEALESLYEEIVRAS